MIPSYNYVSPGKLTTSNIDTTLIHKPSKIETNHGELSTTETLPDVIYSKPDNHKPMSRLYDRPRLQHTHVPHVSPVHVPPVSPVLNSYSDIEASLRRRTHTYSDVTTSLLNSTHSTHSPIRHPSDLPKLPLCHVSTHPTSGAHDTTASGAHGTTT